MSILINSPVTVWNHGHDTEKKAWQSGLVLLDETAEWNETDWPPLKGRRRYDHSSVVVDHPDKNNNHNHNGQTIVVMGGVDEGWHVTNSVLVLNLAKPDKQWQEGPPMNQRRRRHAAVVCNRRIYVIGGGNDESLSHLDSIERIHANTLIPPFSTSSNTHESRWTTLNCRLSTGRGLCCAVAVHKRYIVVMGGYNRGQKSYLSSVDIVDTSNHTVIAGPSMNVPRQRCASAVIGHRIFVVGGCRERIHSVEFWDFPRPCYNDEIKEDTAATVTSFSSAWTTHSDLALSDPHNSSAVVVVGSCLVVTGGWTKAVEVLDTHRNRMWNLPQFENHREDCSMVTVGNQIAVISGMDSPTCATLPLMDKNTWCFRQLFEQPRIEWYHCDERSGDGDVNVTSWTISSSTLKRLRTLDYPDCDQGEDDTGNVQQVARP